jgi:uncharacterized membrane protein
VSGGTLWANLHLLFWLSLIPFVTGWMNENHYAPLTVAGYGFVLMCAALSYTILVRVLLRHHGPDSPFARALGSDRKGNLSLAAYIAAVPLAFVHTWIALAIYVAVAGTWLIPDRRFEHLKIGTDPN